MTQIRTGAAVVLAAAVFAATPAFAQNWSFDARRIALGGVGTNENLAARTIQEEREYRAVVLPFGLLQVLGNRDVFNPDSDRFDLVRGIEYAASPMHYTFGREDGGTGSRFVTDIRNGGLSRDLNDYRGFVLVNQPVAEGLAAPRFGWTVPMHRGRAASHGLYVGAGPYLSMRGALSVDQPLIDLLASETPVYLPDAQVRIGSGLRGQAAMAATLGYRGRLAAFDAGGPRDGLYVAANYNYLHGFRYENADLDVRLETDGEGLLTLTPSSPAPVLVTRDRATSGRGFSMDVGVGAVIDRWEVGVGANGLSNRIAWTGVERTSYTLANPFVETGFTESAPAAMPDARVELPVEYLGNLAYRADTWSAVGEVGRGLQGTSLHAGVEYRFGLLEPRIGVFYSRDRWQPSAGIGLTFAPRVGLDVAMYATDANVQRERRLAVAASLRIGG